MSLTPFFFSYGVYNALTLSCVTELFTFYLTMNLTSATFSQICIDFFAYLESIAVMQRIFSSAFRKNLLASIVAKNRTDLILYVTTDCQMLCLYLHSSLFLLNLRSAVGL